MFIFNTIGFFSGTYEDVLKYIEKWIVQDKKTYVCITATHGMTASENNPMLIDIHNNSGLTVPDGMPLVWIGRMKGHNRTQRIYGPELMKRICALAEQKQYRIVLYGTTLKTLKLLRLNLLRMFPQILITGSYAPPFRALTMKETVAIQKRINSANPHIVFVGLSTPKQELWIAENRNKLQANILIGVGAAFDFLAGTKKQAPSWMQKYGLEWFFRLVHEPKRLWKRYLTNCIFLIKSFRN